MTAGQRVGVTVIRCYQLALAPFSGGACRFEPSCSVYALEAVEGHGLVRGLWLAVRRLARCHPFAQPGIDPVPACARHTAEFCRQGSAKPNASASRSQVAPAGTRSAHRKTQAV